MGGRPGQSASRCQWRGHPADDRSTCTCADRIATARPLPSAPEQPDQTTLHWDRGICMRILGTLTHRADHRDWLLQLDGGYIDPITGIDLSDPHISSAQLLLALGDALKPIAEREGIDD